jgi:hypothetical protein
MMKKLAGYGYKLLLISIMAVLFCWTIVSLMFVTMLTVVLAIIFGICYGVYLIFNNVKHLLKNKKI